MAVKLADVVAEMKKLVVAQSPEPPRQQSERILELAADFLLRALARDPENGLVSILKLVPEYNLLTFVYPRHLAHGNTVLVDRESIAGRVVLRREALVENDVPNEPHKDFFERIPDEQGSVRDIQKMIAAPLVTGDGRVIGVVEVSRTGASPAAAGPDFSPRDAKNLGKCCRAFSPFMARIWTPERSG